MSRDVEQEVRTMAQFAAEVYLIADAAMPEHLSWHVRLYDDPQHATPHPVVELRVAQGARGRKIVWTAELVAHVAPEGRWPSMIRNGIESLRSELAV